MLDEAVQAIFPTWALCHGSQLYDGTYVDCTFGRGGHTREILKRCSANARVFAFDVDPDAIAEARRLESQDSRFTMIHRPFGDIAEVFEPGQVNGVLLDLGVSSPQLDEAKRGFNSVKDGPLDMRMNPTQGFPASEWLRTVTVEELAWVISNWGEDEDPLLAERIAEHILARQRECGGRIDSTGLLSRFIKEAKSYVVEDKMAPPKLTFQAIRVHLNQEMRQLDRALTGAMQVLVTGGRCSVISFKKKEANAIRQFVREHEEPDRYLRNQTSMPRLCELYPLLLKDCDWSVRQIAVKSVDEKEREWNWRSRSSAVHRLLKLRRECERQQVQAQLLRGPAERFVRPSDPAFLGAPSQEAMEVAIRARREAAAAVKAQPSGDSSSSWACYQQEDRLQGWGRPRGEVMKGCKVWFSNVPSTATEQELRAKFGEVGRVVSVEFFGRDTFDSRHRCGLVEYESEKSAAVAVRNLNDCIIAGARVFVRWDREGDAGPLPTPAATLPPSDSPWAPNAFAPPAQPSAPEPTAPAPQAPAMPEHPPIAEMPTRLVPPLVATGVPEAQATQRAELDVPTIDRLKHIRPNYVAMASCDYTPESPPEESGYIEFRAGDTIYVLYEGAVGSEEEGWSYGYTASSERAGWFPTKYVEEIHH